MFLVATTNMDAIPHMESALVQITAFVFLVGEVLIALFQSALRHATRRLVITASDLASANVLAVHRV